ncbi:hypothetical protein SAMD00019534_106540, partial [Acytostelium subglobosum LB1]|uniref:hypothetical protein n=1 Tax=Acytostelium subglobosum LB1 TaxID=1410327 RepID=UPI00064484A4
GGAKHIPNARSVLKKFFLKVHPDLFYQYPNMKKVNDQSLRALQSFLEEVKSGKVTTKSYTLEFFYLDSKSATSTDESTVPHISVSFDIDNSTPRRLNQMIRKAEKQLQYMLKSIGIKEEFHINSLLGKSTTSENYESSESLLGFLKNNAEHARDMAKYVVDEERSIDIMYTFFFMEHKIRVLFDHEIELTTEQKKTILRHLEQTLHTLSPRISDEQLVDKVFYSKDREREDRARKSKLETFHFTDEQIDDMTSDDNTDYNNITSGFTGFGQRIKAATPDVRNQMFEPYSVFKDKDSWRGWDKIKAGFVTPETTEKTDDSHISLRLEGMTLFFTNKSGIDLEGRLQLHQTCHDSDQADKWIEDINNIKPSLVIDNIKSCRNRKKLNSPMYLDYLNNMLCATVEPVMDKYGNQVGDTKPKLNDINIRVLSPNSTLIEPFSLDEQNGVINVPMNGQFGEVTKFIAQCGDHVIREFVKHQNQVRNLNQLELTVKRQFRLLKLKRHPDITDLDLVSCLRRMLNNHQPFLPLLYNIKLVIGKEYAMGSDGSITIKWDFEL